MKKTLAVLILTASTAYCVGLCGGEENYQGGQESGFSQSMQGTPNDQQLTNNIQDSLRSSNKYNHINATVNKGYVTLTGTVATPDDKMDLDKRVRNMEGVQGLDNQVMIQG